MLTVDDYGAIRRAHRDGASIREIARTLHHARRKVRQALREPEPRKYGRRPPASAPKLDPVKGVIDAILAADEQAPPKQRHEATQIFRRLVAEHGYRGGYDQVRRYVRQRRRQHRETFLPLVAAPGQRAEADFGHIWVDFPDGRRQVAVLLVTWAWSYAVFAVALPTERVEAVLDGLVQAWEFFGCVPRELWWDNPTTVAVELLRGRQRKLNERYAALASHYRFEPLFCLPARGNEKPHVENRVKHLERRWATPVPQAQDLAELNAWLQARCLVDRQRAARGQSETIGARWEQERTAAVELPAHRFDPCIAQPAVVDKYQMIAFDGNRYSVPRPFAFQTVTVKGYVDRVVVIADGAVVAEHRRSYARGEQLLEPRHYLAILSRKPAYLDHTAVFRNWQLPPQFDELRRGLEERHGRHAGARQYARVLQLLGEHPVERLERAIDRCRGPDGWQVDALARWAERLRAAEVDPAVLPAAEGASIPAVHVPRPDLCRFDQLLSLGEER
jgi:transposase